MINGLVLTQFNKNMCEDIVISARKTDRAWNETCLYGLGTYNQFYFATCYWCACTKIRKWAAMYMRMR
jgi:hypothetical protein